MYKRQAEGRAAALALKRGTVGSNVMYFETGQGSALSAGAHHGVDQQTLEVRAYAVARTYSPLLVNSVVGFIGPEYLFNGKQILRAGLEMCIRDSPKRAVAASGSEPLRDARVGRHYAAFSNERPEAAERLAAGVPSGRAPSSPFRPWCTAPCTLPSTCLLYTSPLRPRRF